MKHHYARQNYTLWKVAGYSQTGLDSWFGWEKRGKSLDRPGNSLAVLTRRVESMRIWQKQYRPASCAAQLWSWTRLFLFLSLTQIHQSPWFMRTRRLSRCRGWAGGIYNLSQWMKPPISFSAWHNYAFFSATDPDDDTPRLEYQYFTIRIRSPSHKFLITKVA